MNIDFDNISKFNTIKSKITLILAVITVVFFAVIALSCYTYLSESEELILDSYDHTVSELAQALNSGIVEVEHNAADLAVVAKTHAEGQLDENTVKQYLISDLHNYKEPAAVGIWCKPYQCHNEKLHSSNVVRGKNGQIFFDDKYNSDKYNYPEKSWYKRIIDNVQPDKVVWTLSHSDEEGFPLLITAGAGIYLKGKLIGISTVDWDFDSCVYVMEKVRPTPNSFSIFADEKNNYVYFSTDKYLNSDEAVGKKLEDIPWYNEDILKSRTSFTYHNIKYIPFIKMLDNGMMLIVNIPESEMLGALYTKLILLLVIMSLFSGVFITSLYRIIDNDIIEPIDKLIAIAHKISCGDLATQIKIEKPAEFALLASTYDKMTDNIKQITTKQTKMNYELSIANSIQISSLPNVFPPFPEHKEFSIYASMEPAKEVGGDFYDFFFKDKDNIIFLVGDVSGKGVPAALFMMTVKTLINNLAQTIDSPEELIQTINKKMFANNKEGFFATVFASIVNIHTGEMTCINCGHNPPLLKRNGGKYEYLNLEPNMVLGLFDKIDFQIYKTTLNTGDSIFLYTDGITEAVNYQDELYGEERLEESINSIGDVSVEQVLKKIKEDVRTFTRGYSQSDDATMLLFKYFKTLRTIEKPAVKENYKEFNTWLRSTCSEWNLNDDLTNKLDMCGEEIFANICFYAYPESVGNIKVSLEKNEKELTMQFEDSGVFYNPLEKPDPDLTIPPKERKLGGLGIYMVKQMAKEMKYQRTNDKNILSLKFDI